jgi:hypothetical protein
VAAIGARTKQERMLMEQDFKLNVYGRVMEQYKHPVSYLESGAFPSFTRTKKYIRDRFGLWLHNYQADKTAKANILGFTEAALCEEVARMYLEVQGAQAVMQADLARDVSDGRGACYELLSHTCLNNNKTCPAWGSA